MNANWTATKWLNEIQSRRITCVQALEFFEARYTQYNPAVNAIIATDFDAARERAQAADAALERGETWGLLHGLPMTIKDSFEYIGMPTTSGAPELASHFAARNAEVVQRVLDAGAVIFGKTNLPLYALDFQSYNEVHGTTNNPHDLKRTPGGSSGGSAAALAAGLTPLEIGSDIAGSIRLPAHFCGVYGHKPTIGVMPLRGHIPGPPGTLAEGDLAVAGPMATSADDLMLAMRVLVGARPYDSVGIEIKLPEPRKKRLQEYRVAYWLDDNTAPIEQSLLEHYHQVIDRLRTAGVAVTQARPLDLPLAVYVRAYTAMLSAAIGAGVPGQQYRLMGIAKYILPLMKRLTRGSDVVQGYVAGMTQSYRDFAPLNEQREKWRFGLRDFFRDYDVLLTPVAMTQAFAHLHEGNILSRSLTVNGQSVAYAEILKWNSFATLLGLPATSAPVGTVNQLPINMQIIGAAYRDYETIAFAEHLLDVLGHEITIPQQISLTEG